LLTGHYIQDDLFFEEDALSLPLEKQKESGLSISVFIFAINHA